MTHADASRSSETRRRPARSGLSWVALGVLIIAAIELLVSFAAPNKIDRNNFFEYRFGHDEAPERVLVEDKLNMFADANPNILQVGDSSGFHGVMPPVVEGLIPGARYLNMSVFANLGYRGHYEMARAIMKRSKSVRVLVLHVTPAGFQPNPAMVSARDLLGQDIWREFASPLHAVFHLPTLALRRDVTGLAYEGRTRSRDERDARALRRYPDAKSLLPQTGGWTREHDDPDDRAPGAFAVMRASGAFPPAMPDAEVMARATASYGESPAVFDWTRLRHVSLAEQVFDDFRALAEAHNARLVLASAPMSDIYSNGPAAPKLAVFQQTLAAYHAKHPFVGVVPMTFWPDYRFSSPVHVATPYTVLNSVRFATALKEALGFDGLSALAGDAAPIRPSSSDIPAEAITGYALSSPMHEGKQAYRTFRQGRAEALIHAHAKADTRLVEIDVAPDAPRTILDALTLSVFGAAAERMDDIVEPDKLRLRWRLPPSAMKYAGWLELLLSTRAAREWRGDEASSDAPGAALKITHVRFSAD